MRTQFENILVSSLLFFIRSFYSPLTFLKLTINDLLGGRGWWLVKGALVRGPFLLRFVSSPLTI